MSSRYMSPFTALPPSIQLGLGCMEGAVWVTEKKWMGGGGGSLWCLRCLRLAESSQQKWLSQSLTTLDQEDCGEACKKCLISVRRNRGREWES